MASMECVADICCNVALHAGRAECKLIDAWVSGAWKQVMQRRVCVSVCLQVGGARVDKWFKSVHFTGKKIEVD